nr:DNA polymerase IV [Deinobacterium chartae]
MRKIVHVDMDAFYASVEVRDRPELRGLPVAVGWSGPRGVVLTASYEARAFGVHSAQATRIALERCPQLVLLPPRMEAYREVSQAVREIFLSYTERVEPLSLDEAYLDVTEPRRGPRSATLIAAAIRREIRDATGLTASAGVSCNKFLAKTASGLNKPNGLTVIAPEQAEAFVAALEVRHVHGIGPVTARRLRTMGVRTGADLRQLSLEELVRHFGRQGEHYYRIARGIDPRPVEPDRPRKSLGAETTFEHDLDDLGALEVQLELLAKAVARRLQRAGLLGRVVVLKLKYADFQVRTRRLTLPRPTADPEELRALGIRLLRQEPLARPLRLLGITVQDLRAPAAWQELAAQQLPLFAESWGALG